MMLRIAALSRRSLIDQARCMSTKVSVANVKELRKLTALPMKLCREALQNGNDDIQSALIWLESNEEARAQRAEGKLAGRATSQGRIEAALLDNSAALLQVNCETDFVARNDEFGALMASGSQALAQYVAEQAADLNVIELLEQDLEAVPVRDSNLGALTKATMATVGENVQLARGAGFHQPGAVFGSYIHNGAYGAIVMATGEASGNEADALNKIAQHVVAMDPSGESREETISNLVDMDYLLDASIKVGDFFKTNCPNMTLMNVMRWER
eukprot:TRINITY_DN10016_c0_g1_i1.p1 TRINITY_DN10016_c0_g1~~TRINITY_DN10016_c0_g1_i1.p1  ORF type:complete len:271 (+),score=66.44 TRINITY_DN10016_c0_g1_i1:111-923(+)